MRLCEHEAKELFCKFGIPTPEGRVATSAAETKQAARELGLPRVLKSQVLTGGRGRAGAHRAGTFLDIPRILKELDI